MYGMAAEVGVEGKAGRRGGIGIASFIIGLPGIYPASDSKALCHKSVRIEFDYNVLQTLETLVFAV